MNGHSHHSAESTANCRRNLHPAWRPCSHPSIDTCYPLILFGVFFQHRPWHRFCVKDFKRWSHSSSLLWASIWGWWISRRNVTSTSRATGRLDWRMKKEINFGGKVPSGPGDHRRRVCRLAVAVAVAVGLGRQLTDWFGSNPISRRQWKQSFRPAPVMWRYKRPKDYD